MLETLTHLKDFIAWLSASVSVPTLVLFALLVLGFAVAFKAQERQDFDFADMLRDDSHKPSALRLAIFVSLAISSWLVVYTALDTKYSEDFVLNLIALYLIVWSGVKVVEKLVEVWISKKVGILNSQPAMAALPTVTAEKPSPEGKPIINKD